MAVDSHVTARLGNCFVHGAMQVSKAQTARTCRLCFECGIGNNNAFYYLVNATEQFAMRGIP